MDTPDNMNVFPPEESRPAPTFETEPTPATDAAEPVAQSAPPAEPAPAAEPVFRPAPQQNPYWSAAGYAQQNYTQPTIPEPKYYPPGYQQPQYHSPVSQPGSYAPRYQQPYCQTPVYAQPGSSQNAYVPPVPPVPPAPKAKKKKGGFWRTLVAAILILALVAGSCYGTAVYVNRYWEQKTDEMQAGFSNQIGKLQAQIDAQSNASSGISVSGSQAAAGDGLTPAQVYAQNVKSVVAITCTVASSYYGQPTTGTSSGSGFILTEDGYVVTNYHVVEGATAVTVTTNDGTAYTAAIVGGDSTNDIAVLKVEGSGMPAVTIGSSSALIVGDQVAAVGNALGELTNSLTVGYISAKDRMVTTDGFAINMLQTDTAINSGNSGGPLFNMYGEVVGITTAKYSGSSSSGATIEGIGFAIPIDDVIGMIEDLMSQGYISGAYLGVSVSDMDAQAAAYYGLPVGAYVQEATAGYAAARAGIQAKDIIVALGEYEINGVTSLTRALRNFAAGDTTTITVYRNGAELVLTITLDAKPGT